MVIVDGELKRLEENDISDDGSLVIPEGIRSIGRDCLYSYKEITSLQLPQSLEHISQTELAYLTNLTKLYIPDNIKRLGSVKAPFQFFMPMKEGALTFAKMGEYLHPWEYLRLPKGFTYRNPATDQNETLDEATIVVDLENIDRIIAENNYKGEDVVLNIKNAAELPVEKLEKLSQIVKIKKIQIIDVKGQGMGHEANMPYDVDTYMKCKTKIDELLEKIDFKKFEGVPNREKYIFGEIVRNLSNITFDKVVCREGAFAERFISSRNLVGGLLDGMSVCAGYSEILRNVLACCGIESKIIAGFGHAWNQVKLDGKWYNVDLTFDQPKILKGKKPQFLLKSDKDFKEHSRMIEDYNARKKDMKSTIIHHSYKENELEECTETVPDEELMKYVYGEDLEPPKKRISLKSIKEFLFGKHKDKNGE